MNKHWVLIVIWVFAVLATTVATKVVLAADTWPALYPMPSQAPDFGPRAPFTGDDAIYYEAASMGPRRYSPDFLGAEPCPIPGYRVTRYFRLSRGQEMYVAVDRRPFSVKKGAKFIVQKGAKLSVVPNCR